MYVEEQNQQGKKTPKAYESHGSVDFNRTAGPGWNAIVDTSNLLPQVAAREIISNVFTAQKDGMLSGAGPRIVDGLVVHATE